MVKVEWQGDVTLIEMGREYDALDEPTLRRASDLLLSQAQMADPPLLVLDLSQTAYIGSAAIEMIFRAWKRLRERGGRLVLCGLQPFCADVLKAARLDSLWDSFATREEAVAGVQQAS